MHAGLFVAALVLAIVVFIWYSIVSQGAANFESQRTCPICNCTGECDCVDDAWAYWEQEEEEEDHRTPPS